MDTCERLAAIEAIKQLKARYWRGVDDGDAALVRSILAEDCELDYRGCAVDPITGIDHMPSLNMVLKGRDSWPDGTTAIAAKVVTVHQGNDPDITIESERSAHGTWAFTDRFFMPDGGAISRFTGWGRYHETYENKGDGWKLKTTRITRYRIEVE